MAFWENMTVGQMGVLLQERNREDLKKSWETWRTYIDYKVDGTQYEKTEKESPKAYHLAPLPKAPAGYFLAAVAVICEHSQEKGILEMAHIGKKYLDGVLDRPGGGHDWDSCLELMIPREKNESESSKTRRKELCWSHIETLVRNTPELTTQTHLPVLLDHIIAANRKYFKEKDSEENLIHHQSIVYLKETLNAWEDLEELCKKYCPDPDAEDKTAPAGGGSGDPDQSGGAAKPAGGCERHGTCEECEEPLRGICRLLRSGVKQIILTGAPGTGKTYAATKIAECLGAKLPQMGKPLDDEDHPYTIVQFHPSYDYTDFVEGLRPVQEKGRMIYRKLDGKFKEFCRRVEEYGACSKRYFFLIDEINRADLSKVFGELMFCLEPGKRGPKYHVNTQYQNLPTYDPEEQGDMSGDIFAGGFYIPENVYIIGTMNDIDRSVESMDFALRRRFLFQEITVDKPLLENAFRSGNFGELLKENAESVAERIMALNGVISGQGGAFNLNEQYYISQGQFAGLTEGMGQTLDELLKTVWDCRIQPLLREYVRGEPHGEGFVDTCKDTFLKGPET